MPDELGIIISSIGFYSEVLHNVVFEYFDG